MTLPSALLTLSGNEHSGMDEPRLTNNQTIKGDFTMELKITISLDNDAFDKDNDIELARILREFANTCEYAQLLAGNGNLRDINGNKVGTWQVTE